MKIFFGIALSLFFTSCAVAPKVDINYPDGKSSINELVVANAPIAVKDYETLGIISAKSSEVLDTNGNHTGSKITYEKLILEAEKLGADDIINLKIDINEIRDTSVRPIQTTYNYTATALAIKYTTGLTAENITNYTQNIENHDIVNKTETRANDNGLSPERDRDTGDGSKYEHMPESNAPVNVTVNVRTQTPPQLAAPLPAVYGVKLIPPLTPQPNRTYKLQVGAFRITQNAVGVFNRLKNIGLNPIYERTEDLLYRVIIPGVSETEIQSVKEKLRSAGFSEVIIRESH
jgi:uncharacterized protein YbjQ (UPF0145 family)